MVEGTRLIAAADFLGLRGAVDIGWIVPGGWTGDYAAAGMPIKHVDPPEGWCWRWPMGVARSNKASGRYGLWLCQKLNWF